MTKYRTCSTDRGLWALILQSKLGACWKCMVFSFGMLGVSVWFFVLFPQLSNLEAYDSLASSLITLAALVSILVFGLLSLAHLVVLLLRRSHWFGRPASPHKELPPDKTDP